MIRGSLAIFDNTHEHNHFPKVGGFNMLKTISHPLTIHPPMPKVGGRFKSWVGTDPPKPLSRCAIDDSGTSDL